jgi:tryptophan synthase alpha chain
MANRIDQTFDKLRADKKVAMIAYIAAGDPTLEATEAIVPALEKAGVDLIELGLPFSDPLADGIVNQLAAARALEAGATTPKVLECVRNIRKTSQLLSGPRLQTPERSLPVTLKKQRHDCCRG